MCIPSIEVYCHISDEVVSRPQAIELTASDELLAMENVDILRQNGFEVEVDSKGEYGQGCRLKLIAQPISKSTVFDMKGWPSPVLFLTLILSPWQMWKN